MGPWVKISLEHPTTRKKRTPDEARTKRRAEGARPRDLDRRIAARRGYTPAARAAPQHQQRPIGPKRRPEQTGNGSDPCLPEPFSAGLSGGKICNAVTCQLLSPFLRSRRPGQLNYCGRIRPTTLIVGTETGHFPADEPNSVVWSSCSSVCGSFSVGARRREPDARLWCVQWELGVLSPPLLMCMEASSRSSVPGSAGSFVGALAVGRLLPCQFASCAGYSTEHGPS